MQLSAGSVLAALAATASGLGTNCHGSDACHSLAAAGNIQNLKAIVDNIQPRSRFYESGKQIACTGSLCAYYQNGAHGNVDQISRHLQALLNSGCRKCGSLPTKPGSNDVSRGELKVDILAKPGCQGACL
ncbi:hypothetical protein CDD83_6680 [Cordyceps sp. RAO-2017]|nr:hypothetical protein CDD83_6680 [Cordyceps sp. RAO-2017]